MKHRRIFAKSIHGETLRARSVPPGAGALIPARNALLAGLALLASALAGGCATAPAGRVQDAPADPRPAAVVDLPTEQTGSQEIALRMHVFRPTDAGQDLAPGCRAVARVVSLDGTGPRPLQMHIFSGLHTGCVNPGHGNLTVQSDVAR